MHGDPLVREEGLSHRTLENRDELPNKLWKVYLLMTEGLEVFNGREMEETEEVHPVADLTGSR